MSTTSRRGRGRATEATEDYFEEQEEVLTKPSKMIFNPLSNRKILVKPIKREDGWLPKNHEANFLYKDAYFEICAPVDPITGNIVQPLTKEEIEFFENIELSYIHGLSYKKGDLSTTKKTDNVWHTYTGEFFMKLKNEIKTLDLSKAEHYILYKMLLANTELVAPSGEAGTPGDYRFKSTFKFKLEEEGFEAQKNAVIADRTKDAWIEYGKIQSSRDYMITALSLAYPSKRFSYESAIEDFKSELKTLVETELDKFLSIVTDPLFEQKSFVYKAIRLGFIVNEKNNVYTEGGDHQLGRNIKEAAEFLSYPENQGVKIEINKKIKAVE